MTLAILQAIVNIHAPSVEFGHGGHPDPPPAPHAPYQHDRPVIPADPQAVIPTGEAGPHPDCPKSPMAKRETSDREENHSG